MKWIGQRISFIEDKKRTTIVIYPQEASWVKGLMGAWFAMWIMIGAIIIWSYFTFNLSSKENVILFVFMFFWAYYAIKVSRAFFWLLWGKELIKIDEAALHYKKSIRNYGRSHPYFFENIKKIAVFQSKEKSFQSVWENSPWIRGGERIDFEYQGRIIRFARKLEEKEAKLLFQLITKKIEERLKVK